MTHPQPNQSVPVENALAASASEATSKRSSADDKQISNASPERLYQQVANGAACKRHDAGWFGARRSRGAAQSSTVLAERVDSDDCPKVSLLGVEFDNVSRLELLSRLKRGVVFTPNVDHIMKLRRDRDFLEIYQKADYRVCDSQILMYVSKFLGKPLKGKLSGSDLFPWFCDYHRHNETVKIFLLGGAAGVASQARARINERIGREIVVGEYAPPYGFETDLEECEKVLAMLESSAANVVAVCLGAPKQEKWIATYREKLPSIDIFMAVGATVDFEAGVKSRAPKFASEIGLEWLYRLICEPRRLWRRYLLDSFPFVGLVMAEKLRQLRLMR